VVQITRFTEDGSRKITRISEANGLDENNQYRLQDLFVSRLRGKTREGKLVAELEPTGTLPSFATEPSQQGMTHLIRVSAPLWK